MWEKIYKLLSRVRKSDSGLALVYYALIMPIFLGFAGLGFDATLWFMEKRQMQTVADSAALTGAYTILASGNIIAEVKNDAEGNGFHESTDYIIDVASPPTSGAFLGLADHVMVTLTKPADRYFSNLLGLSGSTIVTLATAATIVRGQHCVLALDDFRDKALEFTGTSDVDIDCGVASNSNSSSSIYLNGNASLSASPSAQAVGDISISLNASIITPESTPQSHTSRSDNPYGDLVVPEIFYNDPFDPACDQTNRDVKGNEPQPVTLSPGRYCGGLKISAGADVLMERGLYIIDEGEFRVAGNASVTTITCPYPTAPTDYCGVTLILTGRDPASIATVTINGGADMNMAATNKFVENTSDAFPYKGILFFQDPEAVYEDGVNSFLGGAAMNLDGALYFPSQELKYSGGAAGPTKCLQIIANKITFSGNVNLHKDNAKCENLGIDVIDVKLAILVE